MLLSFSANTIAPDILEQTLIGRKEVVGELELELTEKLLNNRKAPQKANASVFTDCDKREW